MNYKKLSISLKVATFLLEDALNEFQAGVKLSRELEKKLNDAEQTVAKLVDKDGNEKTLDPQNASAPEEE